MGNQDNQAFLQIAALFGHQIVTELQALYALEQTAMDLEKAGHGEDDELLASQIELINNKRDVYNKLNKMRTEVEFMASGYNGTPCCGECKVGQFAGSAKDPIAEMLEDLIKSGIGVVRINPEEIFKKHEAASQTGEQSDPAPSENKAQAAAQAAGARAASINLGNGGANG